MSSLHLVDVMHLDGKASGNKDVFHNDNSSSNCVNKRDDDLLLARLVSYPRSDSHVYPVLLGDLCI